MIKVRLRPDGPGTWVCLGVAADKYCGDGSRLPCAHCLKVPDNWDLGTYLAHVVNAITGLPTTTTVPIKVMPTEDMVRSTVLAGCEKFCPRRKKDNGS